MRIENPLPVLVAAALFGLCACAAAPPATPPELPVSVTSSPAPVPSSPISASPSPVGSAATAAARPSVAPRVPPGFSEQQVAAGRLLLTSFTGAQSHLTMRVWVWLPPQYDDPAWADKKFPVVVLFPGGDGVNYTQWFSFGQPEYVAHASASGEIQPFILVEPQLQPGVNVDTECTDLPGQPRVGTFLGRDVPTMLEATFRILPQRTAWGVGGASSGGYCAARLLFAEPQRFAVGTAFAGYFLIDTTLPAGKTKEAMATSPQVIAAGPNPPDVLFHNWVGTSDRHALAQYRAFEAVVRPPTRVGATVVEGAGHTWTAFKAWVPDLFRYYAQHLDKPA